MALAYADDLAVCATNLSAVKKTIALVNDWSSINGISLNIKKSGAMIPKVDNRTPDPPITSIKGIPLVTTYNYLGIMIDNCLNFKSDIYTRA